MRGARSLGEVEDSLDAGAIQGVRDEFDVAGELSPPRAGASEGVAAFRLVDVEVAYPAPYHVLGVDGMGESSASVVEAVGGGADGGGVALRPSSP